MVDVRTLYGMCLKADSCATRDTYHSEQGTNEHILLSVHGFAITSYFGLRWWPWKFPADGERLLASTASEAAIRQRHVVQLGPRGAHGAGALASIGRGRPSGCAELTLASASHQGTAWEFLQGKS